MRTAVQRAIGGFDAHGAIRVDEWSSANCCGLFAEPTPSRALLGERSPAWQPRWPRPPAEHRGRC